MREFHYRWVWNLQSDPEKIWPFVADTNRFNHDAAVPPIEMLEAAGGKRRLRLSVMGIPVVWDEPPYEWIRPHRFGVVRRYCSGPVAELRVQAEFLPQPQGGTTLVYQVWARPSGLLGRIVIPFQLGVVSAKAFERAIRMYDQLAQQSKLMLDVPGKVRFTPGGRPRLAQARERMLAEGAPRDLVDRLIRLLESSDDMSLSRLRPYALADAWKVPRKALLEVFLRATRAGLLSLRWDLLCPLCRGPKQTSASLREIRPTVHCDACNIDFTVNFDQQVELTFNPNPSIRRISVREYCLGGPQLTPHIVLQQRLRPGDCRDVAFRLSPGRYRARVLGLPGSQSLAVSPEGAGKASFRIGGWSREELLLSPNAVIVLENPTPEERYFVVERTEWSDQAVTAAYVTALQTFRDLFSSEALRPGEQISVGSLAIVFTDLKDSTHLYRTIGDAPAFGRVMSHFDVLRAAVAAHDGAIVKTMGDAIMAVFQRPVNALRAVLQAQETLARPPSLRLKAGIHAGPCIAVTLNERLDYFGSNVNIAARLVDLSDGSDVVISAAVRSDPEVAAWLAANNGPLSAVPLEATLKGFGEERFELYRVRRTCGG